MKKISDSLTYTPVVCVLAVICCILWGSASPAIKIGYELFNIASEDTAAQILFAGCRFMISGVLTVLFGSLLSKKVLIPKKESLFPIFKLCLVQTVMQYLFFYMGLANTSGVKSSIINAANVFTSIFFAVFLFKYEKLTPMKLIGCIIGFIGVILINLTNGGIDMNMSFAGEGAIFMAAVSYGLSSGLIKKYSQNENTVVLSGYQFFVGGFIMAIAGFIMGGRFSGFTLSSTALLIYLACISSVAYTLWGILLKHNDVAKVTIFGFANPLFGVLLSAIFLHEQNQAFGLYGILSIILVCLGIFLVNKTVKKKEEN